jgi:hypothetical protein
VGGAGGKAEATYADAMEKHRHRLMFNAARRQTRVDRLDGPPPLGLQVCAVACLCAWACACACLTVSVGLCSASRPRQSGAVMKRPQSSIGRRSMAPLRQTSQWSQGCARPRVTRACHAHIVGRCTLLRGGASARCGGAAASTGSCASFHGGRSPLPPRTTRSHRRRGTCDPPSVPDVSQSAQ